MLLTLCLISHLHSAIQVQGVLSLAPAGTRLEQVKSQFMSVCDLNTKHSMLQKLMLGTDESICGISKDWSIRNDMKAAHQLFMQLQDVKKQINCLDLQLSVSQQEGSQASTLTGTDAGSTNTCLAPGAELADKDANVLCQLELKPIQSFPGAPEWPMEPVRCTGCESTSAASVLSLASRERSVLEVIAKLELLCEQILLKMIVGKGAEFYVQVTYHRAGSPPDYCIALFSSLSSLF